MSDTEEIVELDPKTLLFKRLCKEFKEKFDEYNISESIDKEVIKINLSMDKSGVISAVFELKNFDIEFDENDELYEKMENLFGYKYSIDDVLRMSMEELEKFSPLRRGTLIAKRGLTSVGKMSLGEKRFDVLETMKRQGTLSKESIDILRVDYPNKKLLKLVLNDDDVTSLNELGIAYERIEGTSPTTSPSKK